MFFRPTEIVSNWAWFVPSLAEVEVTRTAWRRIETNSLAPSDFVWLEWASYQAWSISLVYLCKLSLVLPRRTYKAKWLTSRQMADWKIYIVITYACRCIVVNDSWCTQWRHILFFMYTPTHLGRQQHTYTRVRSKVTIFFSLFFGSIATSLLGRFSKLSRIFVISIHI